MIRAMRFAARTLAPLLFALLFTHCGPISAPTANAVTGPFDSRGNYIEDWVDQPDKWYKPSTPSDKPKKKTFYTKKDTTPQPQIAVVEPRSEVTPSKPKPVVAKPKPKPKVVKYTVRKGDSLSRIASRHGVSLSSLRRANGISGDLIRPGQVFTIPR